MRPANSVHRDAEEDSPEVGREEVDVEKMPTKCLRKRGNGSKNEVGMALEEPCVVCLRGS